MPRVMRPRQPTVEQLLAATNETAPPAATNEAAAPAPTATTDNAAPAPQTAIPAAAQEPPQRPTFRTGFADDDAAPADAENPAAVARPTPSVAPLPPRWAEDQSMLDFLEQQVSALQDLLTAAETKLTEFRASLDSPTQGTT